MIDLKYPANLNRSNIRIVSTKLEPSADQQIEGVKRQVDCLKAATVLTELGAKSSVQNGLDSLNRKGRSPSSKTELESPKRKKLSTLSNNNNSRQTVVEKTGPLEQLEDSNYPATQLDSPFSSDRQQQQQQQQHSIYQRASGQANNKSQCEEFSASGWHEGVEEQTSARIDRSSAGGLSVNGGFAQNNGVATTTSIEISASAVESNCDFISKRQAIYPLQLPADEPTNHPLACYSTTSGTIGGFQAAEDAAKQVLPVDRQSANSGGANANDYNQLR